MKPSPMEEEKKLSAEEFKEKGNNAFKANNMNEAIAFYTKAIGTENYKNSHNNIFRT